MKSKIHLFFLQIVICALSFAQSNANHGYVKIEYAGEIDKPFDILFFYLPGSIDTSYENFYIYKFEVTNSEFNNICKSIEERRHESNDTLEFGFQFTICREGEKMILLTKYLSTVKTI